MDKLARFRKSRFLNFDLPVGLVMALAVMAGLGACGVKTDPVPPDFAPPPAVVGLTSNLDQDQMTLSWQVPAEGPPGTAAISGFWVMRAKAALTDKPCQDCLPRFVQVRDLAIPSGAGSFREDQALSYTEQLEPGFRYHFKVVTYSENGVQGGDSNVVTLDRQP